MSHEDKRIITLMDSEMKHIDGHYQLSLLLRDLDISRPNNRNQVLQRASRIGKRFALYEKCCADYTKFVNDIIRKAYARKVKVQCHIICGTCHIMVFIIHIHRRKSVLYLIAVCKYMGTSLESTSLHGPDLTNCSSSSAF